MRRGFYNGFASVRSVRRRVHRVGEIPTAEAEVGPLAAEEPDRQQAGEQLRQRHGQPHAVHLQQPGQQKQPQQQEAEGAGKRDNGGGAPIGQGGKEGGGEDIYPGEEESGGEPAEAVQGDGVHLGAGRGEDPHHHPGQGQGHHQNSHRRNQDKPQAVAENTPHPVIPPRPRLKLNTGATPMEKPIYRATRRNWA